jgi:hypothetical protein
LEHEIATAHCERQSKAVCREYSVVKYSSTVAFPVHGNPGDIGDQSTQAWHAAGWPEDLRTALTLTAPTSVRSSASNMPQH